ncbi:NAD(P)-dependent alcohol dehydrogenase [uncultured Litoreibacter sp.]|uniref:NAD(P)-dependent alcohol dehydrogenase n=1 Tax=uncultured Litoreibacter sp. TaxID=1392394 RepID=UPI002610EE4F|nr:NAD(P)-dependent alcohol dehydrogenase [uncultured Litoreibacter sp.]
MSPDRREFTPPMRAVIHDSYGRAHKLKIEDIARPTCGPDEVLVAVHSVSVNPYDWHNMTGTPLPVRLSGGLWRPKESRLGVDVAGVVEGVGTNVSRFKVGDKVFGFADGCFAEFVCAKANELTEMPDNMSFDEASAVPVAALTALQGLTKHGGVTADQHVLINGASGGVGTFAVQIAKSLGAQVTGVCGPTNGDMVKSLGADQVIDYTKADFTQNRDAYDVVLDNMGNKTMSGYKNCLKPGGKLVVVGGRKGVVLGPVAHMLKALLAFKFGSYQAAVFIADRLEEDMAKITELLASGALKPVIDQTYPFEQIRDAIAHLETGRARGKIIVQLVG